MSWDSYIDHLMVDLPHGGKLESAAVIGQDGGVWASSPGFPEITPDQVEKIIAGYDDSNGLGANGIHIGANKFQLAPGDEVVIRGKIKGGGVTIAKTGSALVVGIYKEPVAVGDCNIIVEKTGEHLVEIGY